MRLLLAGNSSLARVSVTNEVKSVNERAKHTRSQLSLDYQVQLATMSIICKAIVVKQQSVIGIQVGGTLFNRNRTLLPSTAGLLPFSSLHIVVLGMHRTRRLSQS